MRFLHQHHLAGWAMRAQSSSSSPSWRRHASLMYGNAQNIFHKSKFHLFPGFDAGFVEKQGGRCAHRPPQLCCVSVRSGHLGKLQEFVITETVRSSISFVQPGSLHLGNILVPIRQNWRVRMKSVTSSLEWVERSVVRAALRAFCSSVAMASAYAAFGIRINRVPGDHAPFGKFVFVLRGGR